jgi:hypothetical protein
MAERDLLEAAARAAGIDLIFNDKGEPGYYGSWRGLPQWIDWNPREDDGDALRLAVKMKMDVTIGQSVKVVCTTNEHDAVRIVLPLGDDANAATRRAIVTAAAEIGLQM